MAVEESKKKIVKRMMNTIYMTKNCRMNLEIKESGKKNIAHHSFSPPGLPHCRSGL